MRTSTPPQRRTDPVATTSAPEAQEAAAAYAALRGTPLWQSAVGIPLGHPTNHDERAMADLMASVSPAAWDGLVARLWELRPPGRPSRTSAEDDEIEEMRQWLLMTGVALRGPAATPARLAESLTCWRTMAQADTRWHSVLRHWLWRHWQPYVIERGHKVANEGPARVTWDQLPTGEIESLFGPLLDWKGERVIVGSVIETAVQTLPAHAWHFHERWPDLIRRLFNPKRARHDDAAPDPFAAILDRHDERVDLELLRGLQHRLDWTEAALCAWLETHPVEVTLQVADVLEPPLGLMTDWLRTAPPETPEQWHLVLRLSVGHEATAMPTAVAEVVAPVLDAWLRRPQTQLTQTAGTRSRVRWAADSPQRFLQALTSPELLRRLSRPALVRLLSHPDQDVRLALAGAFATRADAAAATAPVLTPGAPAARLLIHMFDKVQQFLRTSPRRGGARDAPAQSGEAAE